MKIRLASTIVALSTIVTLSGCASTPNFATDPMISGLTSSVAGLNPTQAAGGVGSLLGMAKSNMSATDYSTIAKMIPGADKYVKAAKDAGIASISDRTGLTGAFSKLGMTPDQGRLLTGQVLDIVYKAGGDSAKAMLSKALGV